MRYPPHTHSLKVHKVGNTVHYFSRRGLDHGIKSDFVQVRGGVGGWLAHREGAAARPLTSLPSPFRP